MVLGMFAVESLNRAVAHTKNKLQYNYSLNVV